MDCLGSPTRNSLPGAGVISRQSCVCRSCACWSGVGEPAASSGLPARKKAISACIGSVSCNSSIRMWWNRRWKCCRAWGLSRSRARAHTSRSWNSALPSALRCAARSTTKPRNASSNGVRADWRSCSRSCVRVSFRPLSKSFISLQPLTPDAGSAFQSGCLPRVVDNLPAAATMAMAASSLPDA